MSSTSLLTQQALFLKQLVAILPEVYVLAYEWKSITDWEQQLLNTQQIQFDVNKNLSQELYFWENINTQVYSIPHLFAATDFCALPDHLITLIQSLVGETMDFYIFLDLMNQGEYEYVLKLQFQSDFIFSIGIAELFNDFDYNGFNKQRIANTFLLTNPKANHWISFHANLEGKTFTTFPFWKEVMHEYTSWTKARINFLQHTTVCFQPYYKPKNNDYDPLKDNKYTIVATQKFHSYVVQLLEHINKICINEGEKLYMRREATNGIVHLSLTEENAKKCYDLMTGLISPLQEIYRHPIYSQIPVKVIDNLLLKQLIWNTVDSWYHQYFDTYGGIDVNSVFAEVINNHFGVY